MHSRYHRNVEEGQKNYAYSKGEDEQQRERGGTERVGGRERRGSSSNNSHSSSNSSHNLRMGYHRSSSSSSTASSGKQLVKGHHHHQDDSLYGRLERSYNSHHHLHHIHHLHPHHRPDGLSSSSPSPSPEVHKKTQPKFFLGPPSTPGSANGYHSPLRSSPSPSPEPPSSPVNGRVKSPHLLHPGYGLELHPGHVLTPPDRNSKVSSIYDAYWHIPRASLWGKPKACCEDLPEKCPQCQLRDEISSTCSSVNPPPTFTAMDNYHPIRKRESRCSCGAVFAVTTIFSTLVLLLIAAFILYIEMVLKRNQYVPDPM